MKCTKKWKQTNLKPSNPHIVGKLFIHEYKSGTDAFLHITNQMILRLVAAARATEGKAAASWVKAAVLSQVYTVLRLLDLTLVPSLKTIISTIMKQKVSEK